MSKNFSKSIDAEEAQKRIKVSNAVLKTYTIVQIEHRRGGFYVNWSYESPVRVSYSKRWQCRGNDFYPTWYNKYPHGGTSVTSLAQLVRWCGGKAVLPLASWRYWASDKMRLLKPDPIALLAEAGYPEIVNCVLCEREIGPDDGLDWWSHGNVSGPCCGWYSGCKQRIER